MIDRGQVHQDHAVAVRGVVAALVRPGGFFGYIQAAQAERRARGDILLGDPVPAPVLGLRVVETPNPSAGDELEQRRAAYAALERDERLASRARAG